MSENGRNPESRGALDLDPTALGTVEAISDWRGLVQVVEKTKDGAEIRNTGVVASDSMEYDEGTRTAIVRMYMDAGGGNPPQERKISSLDLIGDELRIYRIED